MNTQYTHKADVLIVDDEVHILRLLSDALAVKGYNSDTVDNGAEAIRMIQSKAYLFVITDLNMPGLSGEDIMSEIAVLNGKRPPVVGMSGTPWLLDEGLFDAVLPKPFSLKKFFNIVDSISP